MSAPSICLSPSASTSGFSALRFLIHAVLWLAGVILPLAALAFALLVQCVIGFEPPFVMLVQILASAVVPVANGLLLQALRRGQPALSPRLGHAHGLATGISLLLSLLFVPHLATAIAHLGNYGAGLLLFAPLLSLLAALALRRLWAQPLPAVWPGVLLALAIVVAPEVPQAVSRAGVRMLASEEPATRANGVRLLRYLGNQTILMRMCDTGNARIDTIADLTILTTKPVSDAAACEALYRISGVRYEPDPMREVDN